MTTGRRRASEEQFSDSFSRPMRETEFQTDANHRARVRYAPVTLSQPPAGRRGDAPNGLLPPDVRSGIEREFAERDRLESSLEQQAQFWRDEVANRVNSYRTRRSRKRLAGEFSMKLDFDSPGPASAARAAARLARDWEEPVVEPDPTPAAAAAPAMPARTFQEAPELLEDETSDVWLRQAAESPKIIEFPRPESPPPQAPPQIAARPEPRWEPLFPPADELAEPVLDRLRILEAPEAVELPAPAPISDLELVQGSDDEEIAAPEAAFDLPLQVAPLPQRFTAATLDWLVVLVATAGFAMIVMRTAPGVPHTRAALAMAVLVPVIFWATYQYLFLVHAGTTPGMQMAHLTISTFDGTGARRQIRRWRALVLVLSCVSLGLGFLWALFDEDNLCWHDKVTRTYLTTRR